jgi:hypothetical protein
VVTTFLRALGFVVLHSAIVAAYLGGLVRVIPALDGEATNTLVVAPATLLAALALTVLHVVVRRLGRHVERFAALLIAAWAAMVAYAVYLAIVLRPEVPVLFVPLVVSFAGLYGAPLVLLVGVSAKLTSPLLVARPAH